MLKSNNQKANCSTENFIWRAIRGFCDEMTKELQTKNSDFYYILLKLVVVNLLIIAGFVWRPMFLVATIAVIIFMLFENGIKKLYYVVGLLPFNNVFEYRGFSLSNFILAIFLVLMAYCLFVDINRKKNLKVNIPILVFFALIIIYTLLPIGRIYNLNSKLIVIATIILIYIIYLYKEKLDLKEMFFVLIVSTIMASLVALLRDNIPYIVPYMCRFKEQNAGIFRFSGLILDPNYFALEILTLLIVANYLKYKKQINVLYYPIVIVLSCFGVMTCSKAFGLCFILWGCSILLIEIISRKSIRNKILMIVLLAVSIACSIVIVPKYTECLKNRFLLGQGNDNVKYGNLAINNKEPQSNISNDGETWGKDLDYDIDSIGLTDISTGRFDIWKEYLKFEINDVSVLLFGCGVGAGYLTIDGGITAIHNTAIQLLYYYGIIGVLLILSLIILIFINECKTKKGFPLIGIIQAIVICIMMCSLDCVIGYRFFITIALCLFMVLDCSKKEIYNELKITSNKKKLFIIHRNATVGGVESSLLNFIKFNKDKYDITLCFMQKVGPKLSEFKNVNVIECSGKMQFWGFESVDKDRKFFKRIYFFILKVIRKFFTWNQFVLNLIVSEQEKIEGYDACICFYQDPFCETYILNKVVCYRKYLICHTDAPLLHREEFKEKRDNQFTKILCVSKSCMNNIQKKYPNVTNLGVLANFQDTEMFIAKSKEFEIKYSEDTFNILTVARASYEKAPLRMLNVVKRLQHENFNVSWTFVGGGPLLDKMNEIIKQEDIKNIRLVGSVKNPFPYYVHADLFVLSSISEAAPMVYNEAMTLKLPVLSTNVGSAHEVLDEFGFVCENSEEGIYKALKELLQNNTILEEKRKLLNDYVYNNDAISKKLDDLIGV